MRAATPSNEASTPGTACVAGASPRRWQIARAFILAAALLPGYAAAKPRQTEWTFSPVVGASQPALTRVNDGIFQSPFGGSAELTTDFQQDLSGRHSYPVNTFLFRNPLPAVALGAEAGVEFRRPFGPLTDFVMGVSSWEISSNSTIMASFPIQGESRNTAIYERRAKLSITQYYLGIRRFLHEKTRPVNFYLDANLRELFDIKYSDENVFSFLTGKPAGFKRIAILTSKTTGVFMAQLGVGMDVRLMDRLTLSLEGAYAVGVGDPLLRNVNLRSDFNDGDRLTVHPPLEPGGSNNAIYRSADGRDYQEARLDLNGWRAGLKFNVEF